MGIKGNNVIWRPQPGSQTLFLTCPYFECLYEGTRGPGKTDALIMDFAQHTGQGFGEAWRGILFRLEYKQLDDVVAKSKKWFNRIFPGVQWLSSGSSYKWVWPTGEELLLRHMKNPDDYWDYHGHEYPWIGWEELTNWPTLECYDAMKSCCRSSEPGLPRKYRATCNPFGVGHNVVKDRFINPAPAGIPIRDENGRTRVRLHGSIYENKILLQADPDYLKTLENDPNDNRRKAWLLGDWDIVSGGAIDDVWDRRKHILNPFDIPEQWRVDRSFDWGSSKPFSVGWWAESDGSEIEVLPGITRTFPKGTIFRIAEFYGWNEKINEGCKMSAAKVSERIKEIEAEYPLLKNRTVEPGPADSSIYDADDEGVSIADKMKKAGIEWTKANKKPGSRKAGLLELRDRLEAGLSIPMEEPGLFIFNNCTQFVRTVPVLPRDKNDPDDVDTAVEDHVYDETRYRITNKTRELTEHDLPI